MSVVGSSGSGKSTFAKALAARLDVPYVELDAIHHLPNWQPIDPDEYRARLAGITAADGWVVDGNYRIVTMDGPVWERADTVVWLDIPRAVVMRQVIARTVRRLVTRERLWNGNREPLFGILRLDPEENVVRWAWTRYPEIVERYGSAMKDERFRHLRFVRLGGHLEAADWLATL